jgi:hypothetical protein
MSGNSKFSRRTRRKRGGKRILKDLSGKNETKKTRSKPKDKDKFVKGSELPVVTDDPSTRVPEENIEIADDIEMAEGSNPATSVAGPELAV